MGAEISDVPFTEELPRLLRERQMSLRSLASAVGVSDSHLSRVLRGADYKTPSADLTRRVALALGLPPEYFREYREARVIETVRSDTKLMNRLYRQLQRRSGS